jgi:hypothetical protein
MDSFATQTSHPQIRSVRLTLSGWAGLVVFGALVAATQGLRELPFAAVTIVVALVLATWLWKRRSRAALVTTLMLGGLQLLEQTGYLVADLTGSGGDIATTLVDLFGLVASAAVVAGAGAGLVGRRRALHA